MPSLMETPDKGIRLDLVSQKESLCHEIAAEKCPAILSCLYNQLGVVLYKQVLFEDAVQAFISALLHNPLSTEALFNRATIHFRMGRYRLAMEDLQRALQISPDHPELLTAMTQTRLCLNCVKCVNDGVKCVNDSVNRVTDGVKCVNDSVNCVNDEL